MGTPDQPDQTMVWRRWQNFSTKAIYPIKQGDVRKIRGIELSRLDEILVEAHPHIGINVLPKVIGSIGNHRTVRRLLSFN